MSNPIDFTQLLPKLPNAGTPTILCFAGFFLFLLVLSQWINKYGRKAFYSQLATRPILTRHEHAFFIALVDALPFYFVFPQVSMDVLIQPVPAFSGKRRIALRNRYCQKRPDFVVCQKDTLEVVAVVELDDSSHDMKKDRDRDRDELLYAVGYKTLRFSDKDKPWDKAISEKFAALLKCPVPSPGRNA